MTSSHSRGDYSMVWRSERVITGYAALYEYLPFENTGDVGCVGEFEPEEATWLRRYFFLSLKVKEEFDGN